jgi:hypothetical protein
MSWKASLTAMSAFWCQASSEGAVLTHPLHREYLTAPPRS